MTRTALRALVPVTLLAGLAACTTAPATPVAGDSTTSPVPSATSASPAAPTTVASPTRSAVAATPTTTAEAACPVGAATLQRASGLNSSTHRINPDHIKCARRWATAGIRAVDPGMQGDGVMVFEYSDGTWRKLGEGSALECSPFGIPAEIGDEVGCHDR
ncbi:hypothetical protein ACGFH8_18950 [Micromonospora sp. NPDC049175]|uniref:hypothetical protein n=1 Tax=Micromonospora sp. NPDC049175 TaxID=3364266 RepID=UPI0037189E50